MVHKTNTGRQLVVYARTPAQACTLTHTHNLIRVDDPNVYNLLCL